jgi:hypothetical protein
MGYPGVTRVREAGNGLYVAERDSGLPIAVSVKDGSIEASTAGGAWEHVAAALIESPTLTLRAIGPESGNPDYSHADQGGGSVVAPWDLAKVKELLAEAGVIIEGDAYARFKKLTDDAYTGAPGVTADSQAAPKSATKSAEGQTYLIGDLPGSST